MNKQRKKKSKRKPSKSKLAKLKTLLLANKQFALVIACIALSFSVLTLRALPVESVDWRGLRLLNKYEFPSYLIEEGNCMRPYDVGDGVVTFGPGITYPSEERGIAAINEQLGTKYTTENNCIERSDLKKLQAEVLIDYENIVLNVEKSYDVAFNHDQFNALVLLAYNSPNLFKDEAFLKVITDPQSSYQQYVDAADNYYQQLRGYDTAFGTGWYNRIKDSAELFYYGDYQYQNNLEEL